MQRDKLLLEARKFKLTNYAQSSLGVYRQCQTTERDLNGQGHGASSCDVTPSVELNHGSRRFIFDPNELAIDEQHARIVSGVGYTENVVEDCVDVKDIGVSMAEREDGHKSSSFVVSGKKQLSHGLQPAAGDGFDLPVILLKPGEEFPETRVLPSHPSPCVFDSDQIASGWHSGRMRLSAKMLIDRGNSSGFTSSVSHEDKAL